MSCLNVVSNAVVAWNTVYMHAVLEQLRAEVHTVNDDDVAHLSPARFEHINPYVAGLDDLRFLERADLLRGSSIGTCPRSRYLLGFGFGPVSFRVASRCARAAPALSSVHAHPVRNPRRDPRLQGD